MEQKMVKMFILQYTLHNQTKKNLKPVFFRHKWVKLGRIQGMQDDWELGKGTNRVLKKYMF